MLLYALTILLSSFLLFEVQPMIAKIILPWFGGTAAVWTTCLLFFQVMLLGGYLYAHGMIRYLGARAQGILHLVLLAGSILLLPILPGPGWRMVGDGDPTPRIIALLLASVGLPYFMLSTTGPLLQAWYARTHVGAVPYRLFALSNLGSLLALLTYPLWFEPRYATGPQTTSWSLAYCAFVLVCGAVAFRDCIRPPEPVPSPASDDLVVPPTVQEADPARAACEQAGSDEVGEQTVVWEASGETGDAIAADADERRPSLGLQMLWLTCAAVASVLLLAVTTHLTQNVAPIPFLWVLPLTLYLLSFILCFEGRRLYWRPFYLTLLTAGLAGCTWALARDNVNSTLTIIVPLFAGMLFAACMVCHGELSRLKPHPRHLTAFYLMCSVGGALGGVLVALVAPRVFVGYYELHCGMVATLVLVVMVLALESVQRRGWRRWLRVAFCLVFAGLSLALALVLRAEMKTNATGCRAVARNFYGSLRVVETGEGEDAERTLAHGTIQHGQQFLSQEKRHWPTTYYGKASGIGLAILNCGRKGPQRVGSIGLGTGTLAAYGRKGDTWRIYEINPLVLQMARTEFTYLKDCPSDLTVVMGDARLSLEREDSNQFDVLSVDAFSGDAIPVHLLTREAFAVYFRHLKPGGVLAVHISNRYLDLEPVVKMAAEYYDKQAREVTISDDDAMGVSASSWILVGGDASFFKQKEVRDALAELVVPKPIRPWTDDYSNLYQILKVDPLKDAWTEFWDSFKKTSWLHKS